ncbi:MAG: phage tail protein [Leptolyngbya sp.]|nr:MAG: phage tail protein [Leptolyngbya sp.]
MPVNPTYPGIYIEELPSSTRTITAAPTSIAVFVGYTHPFKTKTFNKAIQVFNFTEYEREFGGLYNSGLIEADVAYAVNDFFLNGGSVAYVVGLRAQYHKSVGPVEPITPPTTTVGPGTTGVVFTGLEPTDQESMLVTVKPNSTGDKADVIVAYGSRVETYRAVNLIPDDKDFIEKRLGTGTKQISSLVTVSSVSGGYGATFTATAQVPLISSPPASFTTTFNETDFLGVFQQDSSLDKVSIFNLLVLPGVVDNSIWSAALAFCERKQAFLILDPPGQAVADRTSVPSGGSDDDFLMGNLMTKTSSPIPKSTNGAIYFPYLKSTNPLTGNPIELPPSGFVAGIYARTDLNRGVWKAPAGLETTLLNTTGVVESGRMTDQRQGTLNPIGVNCLRSFPGVGTVVYGARTLVGSDTNTSFQQWKYVPVRRIALFIEQTLIRNLGWVVFEPNDEPLWAAIRTSIEGFMLSLFSQGAFQGSTPSQAFQVKCDKSTTTQTDIDLGKVNIVVAFAPLKPAEFVIIKIAQLAGQVQA